MKTTKALSYFSIFVILLATALTNDINAQFTKKGILLKNLQQFKKGDTVTIFGKRYNSNSLSYQYYIKDYSLRFIDTKKVQLLEDNYDFWQEVWFQNKALDFKQNGWAYAKAIQDDARDYLNQTIRNNLIFQDDFLYDYLYQLLNKIHPDKLIKPKPTNFGLLIIKSSESRSFAFDNGLIVLSTEFLAQTKSEHELVKELTKCIAHIVLEHNSINLKQQLRAKNRAEFWGTVTTLVSSAAMAYSNNKNGTNFNFDDAAFLGASAYLLTESIMDDLGTKYSAMQFSKSKAISEDYFKENSEKYVLTTDKYLARVSNIISYCAWQHFYGLDYYKSLDLVNRLIKAELATPEDYLLLVKLKRMLNGSDKNCSEILEIIRLRKGGLIDFYKEEVLIYLRLNKNMQAREALINYKTALLILKDEGQDVLSELNSVEQLLFRL